MATKKAIAKPKNKTPKLKKAIAIKIAVKPVKVNPNMGAMPNAMPFGNAAPVGKAKKSSSASFGVRMAALRAKKKKK
jgi:hypothetical protein